jgi:hypothetical protein
MKALLACVALAIAVTGCARPQSITPVSHFEGNEICVVENTDVDPVFLQTYLHALRAKGYSVRMLPGSAAVDACRVTTLYRGAWKMDVQLYLAFAEIRVYEKGLSIGRAAYDTKRSNLNLRKFKDAQETIAGLVNDLFPIAKGAQ